MVGPIYRDWLVVSVGGENFVENFVCTAWEVVVVPDALMHLVVVFGLRVCFAHGLYYLTVVAKTSVKSVKPSLTVFTICSR